jgi:hypothetical protein
VDDLVQLVVLGLDRPIGGDHLPGGIRRAGGGAKASSVHRGVIVASEINDNLTAWRGVDLARLGLVQKHVGDELRSALIADPPSDPSTTTQFNFRCDPRSIDAFFRILPSF